RPCPARSWGLWRFFPEASWPSARYARPTVVQGGRHLGSRVESRIRILGQRPIDDEFDALRKVRPERPQWRMRYFCDLLHQSRHRIGSEGELAGQQLKQANTQGKQVRVSGHSSSLDLF